MSELYIPPERFERDFITGRFLKGCVSRNKGRKMVYHSIVFMIGLVTMIAPN